MNKEQEIKNLIEIKKQEIERLASELAELFDREIFESPRFVEEELVIKEKTGKKKKDFIEYTVKAGYEKWIEDFIDEDTGDVIPIERQRLVSINGKRTDIFGRCIESVGIEIIEEYSEEPFWRQ